MDGNPHDWETNDNDEWKDTGIEDGKTIVLATYHAKTQKCRKCGAFEVLSGNVVTSSGTEYLLEKDGRWGMCVG